MTDNGKMSIRIEWVEGEMPIFTYLGISKASIAARALQRCIVDVRQHFARGIPLCEDETKIPMEVK